MNCQVINLPRHLLVNIQTRRIFRVSKRVESATTRRPANNCDSDHASGRWRRSSASTPCNECVEVSRAQDCVDVRDSKASAPIRLSFDAAGWDVFLDRITGRWQSGTDTRSR
ncbi:DUF397 domain-containing protein [Actinophytocola sp.]|uniref:DUF397 domain-containing protein n=1 Tax=Actinophytocola sp. TaxID=1872138 RepID=UPI002D5139A3|nr:DUF397 domain-containing protein [Actinophytocola sp.]HYQ61821.1 DUF397 domain-containing protein [Actinophytocola sp.]